MIFVKNKKYFKIELYVLLVFSFLMFGCSPSATVVVKKGGVSHKEGDKTVFSVQTLRQWYDAKDYEKIYDELQAVASEKEIKDYFVHFVFLEAAYYQDKIANFSELYAKGNKKYFYLGVLAYEKSDYDIALRYFRLIKERPPLVQYLIGSSYFYEKSYSLALGYLMLSRNWSNAPWPHLSLASLHMVRKRYRQATSTLKTALSNTYAFEKNVSLDIKTILAQVYFLRKMYKESYFYAMEVYRDNPSKILSSLDPGDILLAWKKRRKAKAFWKKAILRAELNSSLKNLLRKKLEILKELKK